MRNDGREKGDLFWKKEGEGLLVNCGAESEKKRESWSRQGAPGVGRAAGSHCPRRPGWEDPVGPPPGDQDLLEGEPPLHTWIWGAGGWGLPRRGGLVWGGYMVGLIAGAP